MYLLDTDTLTHAHQGHPLIVAKIQEVGEESVATTIVNEIEILQGRYDFLLKAADGQQLLLAHKYLMHSEMLFQQITVKPVDNAAAREFDKLRQNKKLKKIGRADLLIASIVLANKAILVTRNRRDFLQIPGLKVENWAK